MKAVPIKQASRPIKVMRDAAGVPHVSGPTWLDALYGLGYVHALDRPTQMWFSRTVASGRAAEHIADRPNLVETDRFFRKVGLYINLKREISNLSPVAREQLEAYCQGATDGMRQHGRSLPMWASGFVPEPWDLDAVLLVCNLLNFGGLAIGQQQSERLLLELVQSGIDRAQLREMFEPLLDNADFALLEKVKISNQLSDEALELITDLPRLAGSNAWAVGPDRSASGSPMLAADPHLEVNRLPAIWYEVVLRWGDDSYVMGASLPGSPVFGVARSHALSWGVTYVKGDTSDYFIEDCRRDEAGAWQYRRGEEWHDFEIRKEHLHRKSGPKETLQFFHNPLGTLDVDLEKEGDGLHLLTAWTGDYHGATRSLATWLDLIHCEDVLSAMCFVRELPQPTLCWVFADRDGNIGRQVSGWFPARREGNRGAVPLPAWDERNHWHGWIKSSKLPGTFNPPEGFVSSANENVNPKGGPTFVSLPVPDYRKRRIDGRLRELPFATVKDMQQLQYDVISMQARDLLRVFLPHLPEGDIKRRLTAWDGNYEPSSREATLFSRLYRNVLLEIFGSAPHGIGWRRMLYLCSRVGYSMMVLSCIDRLLQKDHSLWWQDRDKGALIRAAAAKLVGEPDQPWSAVNSFAITNRFFEGNVFGKALGFHSGDLPMRGCHATPFQGHLLRVARRETTFAPSYHFVCDMSTDEAWSNLPGGPSESRFSRFYKNDLELWLDGEYKRLTPESE